MPDRRAHRGPHPEDEELFATDRRDDLRRAVGDLSWLLSRGYAQPSAVKIVGDRYNLNERQRTAVMRCACSDESLRFRGDHRVGPDSLAGQVLCIDGYNVLTTLEAALAGGIILHAHDGCFRDMASMHGTWRKVEETLPALQLLGEVVFDLRLAGCLWLLDRPVSNSGRLKTVILQAAQDHAWNWQVDVVQDPDPILGRSTQIVATADSVILDSGPRWFNLARHAIGARIAAARVVDLSQSF